MINDEWQNKKSAAADAAISIVTLIIASVPRRRRSSPSNISIGASNCSDLYEFTDSSPTRAPIGLHIA